MMDLEERALQVLERYGAFDPEIDDLLIRAMLAFAAEREAAAYAKAIKDAAEVARNIDTAFDTLGDRGLSADYINGQEDGREVMSDRIATAIEALGEKKDG